MALRLSELDVQLGFTLCMPFLSLYDILKLRNCNKGLRGIADEYLNQIVRKIPWRIAVDYSSDFLKVYVTYGWTNFIDVEITSEASDYPSHVESVIMTGCGGNNGNAIWSAFLTRKKLKVNIDYMTMRPYGLNQGSWGIETKVRLGHGSERYHNRQAPDWERTRLTYCDDSFTRYTMLKFQSISKKSKKKFSHKGRKLGLIRR